MPFRAALKVIRTGRKTTKNREIKINVNKCFFMKKAGPSSIAVSMTHPMIIAPKASAIPTAKLASVAKKIVFLAPSIVQKIKGKKDFGGELEAFANGLIIFEKKFILIHQSL